MLEQGMYSRYETPWANRFGIRYGQIRHDDLVHNGSWFNANGEKLGYGDLSRKDIQRIASELKEDEVFVVVPEHISFWNLLTEKNVDLENLGVDFIREHCSWIIKPGRIYNVCDYVSSSRPDDKVIDRNTAATLI